MGRGCADMIITIRQLIEKSNEHKAKIFLDLRKVYDSVPREALWVALSKLGVLDSLIEIIKPSTRHEGSNQAGQHTP